MTKDLMALLSTIKHARKKKKDLQLHIKNWAVLHLHLD